MQVKFPSTEKDCKKVLAFCRKREGKAAYNRPILENFKEDFKSCVMTILFKGQSGKFEVQEVQRLLPINGQPNFQTVYRTAEQLTFYPAFRGMTVEDVMVLLQKTEDEINDAIGQALLEI